MCDDLFVCFCDVKAKGSGVVHIVLRWWLIVEFFEKEKEEKARFCHFIFVLSCDPQRTPRSAFAGTCQQISSTSLFLCLIGGFVRSLR